MYPVLVQQQIEIAIDNGNLAIKFERKSWMILKVEACNCRDALTCRSIWRATTISKSLAPRWGFVCSLNWSPLYVTCKSNIVEFDNTRSCRKQALKNRSDSWILQIAEIHIIEGLAPLDNSFTTFFITLCSEQATAHFAHHGRFELQRNWHIKSTPNCSISMVVNRASKEVMATFSSLNIWQFRISI